MLPRCVEAAPRLNADKWGDPSKATAPRPAASMQLSRSKVLQSTRSTPIEDDDFIRVHPRLNRPFPWRVSPGKPHDIFRVPNMPTKIPITVAHGDGIGPEIMAATLQILDASGAALAIETIEIGEKVYLRGNTSGIE